MDIYKTKLPKTWATVPKVMSYSRLRAIEKCPRSWSLNHSKYENLGRVGSYPSKPNFHTVIGNVIHLAIEKLINKLSESDCKTFTHPRSIEVLKSLGGFTALVELSLDETLVRLSTNQRSSEVIGYLEEEIRGNIPQIRQALQSIIQRIDIAENSCGSASGIVSNESTLKNGMNAEVKLNAKKIHWTGIADLITVSGDDVHIVDFKTGKKSEEHIEQLQIYSFLFARDSNVNPNALIANKLTVIYKNRNIRFPAPTPSKLNDIEYDLIARTNKAIKNTQLSPPPAKPNIENCSWCNVRQMCDKYWECYAGNKYSNHKNVEPAFIDAEIIVNNMPGPKSCNGTVINSTHLRSGEEVLLRFNDFKHKYRNNQKLLLLGAILKYDVESDLNLIYLSNYTEIFQ